MEITEAINSDNVIRVAEYIRSGGDVNALTTRRVALGFFLTPLQFAAGKGSVRVLRLLLESGADPNFGGERPFSPPLFLAIENGMEEALELLLQFGADPNFLWHSDLICTSPLYLASTRQKSLAMTSLLLRYGADPRIGSFSVRFVPFPLITALKKVPEGPIKELLMTAEHRWSHWQPETHSSYSASEREEIVGFLSCRTPLPTELYHRVVELRHEF